ncbi:hypothetical protein V8E52_007264 [Russula decolorans]|jgi:hypothetical protein
MFSLFKRMYVWIPAAPQVSDKPTKDTIIATRPEGARGIRKKTIPGQFSTVLVQESERTSVVPVSKLQRSCHLIPRLGKGRIDPTWHSANILDQDIKFYVNCYLRHIDFILLRRVQ